MVFFECWSQIGGQTPIDMMPWWLKFIFAGSFGLVVCRLTAALVQNERFPAIPVFRWLIALVVLLVVVGLTTYYFFEHEPADQDTDEPVTTSVAFHSAGQS